MTCSEFIARFSEYRDEDPTLTDREAFVCHLDSCRSCRRYADVLSRGVALLRGSGSVVPRADLRDRIRHSIYTREEEERRRGRHSFDASGVLAVAAVGALVAFMVWSPWAPVSEPTVELPPLVAASPPPAPVHPLFRTTASGASPISASQEGLWTQSNVLLLEHSPVRGRSSGAGLVRTGVR